MNIYQQFKVKRLLGLNSKKRYLRKIHPLDCELIKNSVYFDSLFYLEKNLVSRVQLATLLGIICYRLSGSMCVLFSF